MGSQVEERARSISALDLAKSSRIPGLVSAFRALVPIPTQKAPVLDNRAPLPRCLTGDGAARPHAAGRPRPRRHRTPRPPPMPHDENVAERAASQAAANIPRWDFAQKSAIDSYEGSEVAAREAKDDFAEFEDRAAAAPSLRLQIRARRAPDEDFDGEEFTDEAPDDHRGQSTTAFGASRRQWKKNTSRKAQSVPPKRASPLTIVDMDEVDAGETVACGIDLGPFLSWLSCMPAIPELHSIHEEVYHEEYDEEEVKSDDADSSEAAASLEAAASSEAAASWAATLAEQLSLLPTMPEPTPEPLTTLQETLQETLSDAGDAGPEPTPEPATPR